MPVRIGDVHTIAEAKVDRAQALKILEEAAEVFSAWEAYYFAGLAPNKPDEKEDARSCIIAECADIITATCGMLAALGIENMQPHLAECEERNARRGRTLE